MTSIKDRLYIATMCENWLDVVRTGNMAIETDHFCQAENLDGSECVQAKAELKKIMDKHEVKVLHGPFNELFPAAIDQRARSLAMDRLNQAAEIAIDFGIKRMVVHSGYIPFVYFKEWHRNRSVEFWQEFMADKPDDFEICIENVLDDEPYMLAEIAKLIDDKRVGLCYDVGHANIVGECSQDEWLETMAPYLKHLHIHNNDGTGDYHNEIMNGSIDMDRLIRGVIKKCSPQTSITMEVLQCKNSLDWLMAREYY